MKLKPNVAISENGFIFDPTTGESFSTNQEGAEIIKLIKENKNYDEIKQYFLENYDIDEITFERVFFDFISMLNYYNLLETDEQI
jgi:hypothetical protein